MKPARAIEEQTNVCNRIKAKFDTDGVVLGGHISTLPWENTDYDERVPGAGAFASAWYTYGEMCRNASRSVQGPVLATGMNSGLYAGLADGLIMAHDPVPLMDEPYRPFFSLASLKPVCAVYGLGPLPEGRTGEEDVDRYLAAQIAYGLSGRLVTETLSDRLIARSYYSMLPLQIRTALHRPEQILYRDGEEMIVPSAAIHRGAVAVSQIHLRYPDGLQVWVNGSQTQSWPVEQKGTTWTLPPSGWLILGDGLVNYSLQVEGKRLDYVKTDDFLYYDGRGRREPHNGIAAAGPVAFFLLEREGQPAVKVVNINGLQNIGFTPLPDMPGNPVKAVRYDAAGAIQETLPVILEDGFFFLRDASGRAGAWHLLFEEEENPGQG
jgi:hypothetical protein